MDVYIALNIFNASAINHSSTESYNNDEDGSKDTVDVLVRFAIAFNGPPLSLHPHLYQK